MIISRIVIVPCLAAVMSSSACDFQERERVVVVHDQPATEEQTQGIERRQGVAEFENGAERPNPVIAGPGVTAVDAATEPPQRNYVYDPGFPPGTYFSSGYYYYDGYRYPQNAFVSGYVQNNINQQRFVDVAENRRQVQALRSTSAINRGVSQNARDTAAAERSGQQTTVEPARAAAPSLERHEIAAPAPVKEQNGAAANQPLESDAPRNAERAANRESAGITATVKANSHPRDGGAEKHASAPKAPVAPGGGEGKHEPAK